MRERIVVDAEPVVKRKLELISDLTGKTMKRIIVDFIEAEFEKHEDKIIERKEKRERMVIFQ